MVHSILRLKLGFKNKAYKCLSKKLINKFNKYFQTLFYMFGIWVPTFYILISLTVSKNYSLVASVLGLNHQKKKINNSNTVF